MVWVAGVLALPAALLLAVIAVDVLRSPRDITAHDTRFQTAPLRQLGLWDVGFLPRDLSERLLGLDDDIAYRRALGLYLRVEPGRIDFEGFPELEALRGKAQFEITRMSQEEPDPARRSRLLTLYGVMTLDGFPLDDEARRDTIRRAVSAFRNAIELDADNEDAKRNLETVLGALGPVFVPASDPTRERAGGRSSGQGSAGSGY